MYSFAIELSSQIKRDNTHSLLIRITRDRKHKRVVTGYCVGRNQFTHTSNVGGWIINHPEAARINNDLQNLISEIERVVEEKRKTLKTVTLETLALWVKNKDVESFLEFADKEVEKYKEKESYRTYMRYASTINKLKDYRDEEGLFFHELTARFFKSYRLFLQGLGNSEATIFADISCIRVIVNKAIKIGYIPIQDDPFLKLNFKAPRKARVVYLSHEEVVKLETVESGFSKQETLAIDSFLFAMYMGGLKFSEVTMLKWNAVVDGSLIIQRQKKGEKVALKLHEKASRIIKKYQQKSWSQDDFVFPLLNSKKDLSTDEKLKKQISSKNSISNKTFKSVLVKLGIDKEITFFSAKHTFAYLASRKSGDLKALSVVLGHSNTGQTNLYLKQVNNTQEDDLLLDVFY